MYLLRPGRTDEAIAIAEAENAVIELEEGYEERYQKLTDENFILVTMAQSQYVRASELFADIAMQELEDHLSIPEPGREAGGVSRARRRLHAERPCGNGLPLQPRGRAFSPEHEGQTRMAEALFNAVKRYKAAYERLLLEGKDLGETTGGM